MQTNTGSHLEMLETLKVVSGDLGSLAQKVKFGPIVTAFTISTRETIWKFVFVCLLIKHASQGFVQGVSE